MEMWQRILLTVVFIGVSIFLILDSMRQIRKKINDEIVPAYKYLKIPIGILGIIFAILLLFRIM